MSIENYLQWLRLESLQVLFYEAKLQLSEIKVLPSCCPLGPKAKLKGAPPIGTKWNYPSRDKLLPRDEPLMILCGTRDFG